MNVWVRAKDGGIASFRCNKKNLPEIKKRHEVLSYNDDLLPNYQ